MRIITLNLNGIRSAEKKGFFSWLQKQDADVVCVQEVRAHEADFSSDLFRPKNYHAYFHCAAKKGYSGVGIYSRVKPNNIITQLGWSSADTEGRYIQADFGDFCVASLYLPSGTSGDARQAVKYDFLDRYEKYLNQLRKKEKNKNFIICGDWNIAHRAIDLKNWKSNQKCSGFLPEERAWMDKLFGDMGWVDAFRQVNQEPDQYTWWSNFGQAWAKNVGWRIDYQVVTPALQSTIQSASIYKDQRFSDHAPVLIDYDLPAVSANNTRWGIFKGENRDSPP